MNPTAYLTYVDLTEAALEALLPWSEVLRPEVSSQRMSTGGYGRDHIAILPHFHTPVASKLDMDVLHCSHLTKSEKVYTYRTRTTLKSECLNESKEFFTLCTL